MLYVVIKVGRRATKVGPACHKGWVPVPSGCPHALLPYAVSLIHPSQGPCAVTTLSSPFTGTMHAGPSFVAQRAPRPILSGTPAQPSWQKGGKPHSGPPNLYDNVQLSQELHTSGLRPTHVSVGHRGQRPALDHDRSLLTATWATSCRKGPMIVTPHIDSVDATML